MIKAEAQTGTTMGIKNDNGSILAINLLGALDLDYLLKEIAKSKPKLKAEIEALCSKLENEDITLCYKSYVGENIFFTNNNFEEQIDC